MRARKGFPSWTRGREVAGFHLAFRESLLVGGALVAFSNLIALDEPEKSIWLCVLSPEIQKCHLGSKFTVSLLAFLLFHFNSLLQILNIMEGRNHT